MHHHLHLYIELPKVSSFRDYDGAELLLPASPFPDTSAIFVGIKYTGKSDLYYICLAVILLVKGFTFIHSKLLNLARSIIWPSSFYIKSVDCFGVDQMKGLSALIIFY